MANKPEEFPVFTPLDGLTLQQSLKRFSELLQKEFVILIGGNPDDLMVSEESLYEIFTRIEQRRIYFHVYHDINMGELNEGALLCFWIIKLSPFKHKIYQNSRVNARIALSIFMRTLRLYAAKTKMKVRFTPKFLKNLYYAFIYRDLSKEAIMALAEGLLY
jgi:hypothetical protein